MGERDAAVATPVGSQTDQPAVQPQLVAALLRHVDDLRLRHRSRTGLELVAAAEVLDQLPARVRLARVAVIDEAATMIRRKPPRVTLAQVREDLASSAKESPLLVLQHRDLIGAGDRPQPVPFVWPRFDLTRDKVDP